MANDKKQAWRGGGGNTGGGGAARGPNYKWKPEDERPPGSGGRILKILLLSVALLGVVGFFVWLAIKPDPTPQATLVGIGANPADDAEFLNVPLDLYGWQTAQQVTELGKEFAKAGRDRTSPDLHPLPADPSQLPAWADKLKDEQFDPLVLYVGLPCGTDRNGEPVLFTGGRDANKKPNQLQVRKLLETLRSDPLAKKKKVLLLDAARLPADPVYGSLHDDFAARMKGLNEEVKKDANLVVVVGASPGQRGWESEEHRITAFGRAVMRALRGHDIVSDGTEQISAKQLFDSVKTQTTKWTEENRPTVQEPFLLPENAGDLPASIIVGVRPKTPPTDAAPPGASPLPPELKQAWDQHFALAQSSPHPASYAPRAWRRYRELLLRWEQCARSGEPKSTAALKGAVEVAFRTVTQLDLPSKANSAALTFALTGTDSVASQLAALNDDPANFPDNLAKTADALLSQFPVSGPRPAEAHLPIMVRDFYNSVVQPAEAVPAEWATAIALRATAERAALGLPATGAPLTTTNWPVTTPSKQVAYHYVERLAPLVEARVKAGDKLRRDIEDNLFAVSKPAAAPNFDPSVKAARDEYEAATRDALIIRTAIHMRDEAFADLPYLAQSVWFVKKPADRLTTEGVKPLRDLWATLHALAAALDEPAGKVAEVETLTKKVAQGVADLRKDLQSQTEERKRATAVTQGEWFAKQQLLTSPLLSAEDRETLLKLSREASKQLNEGSVVRGTAPPPTQVLDPKDAAVIRGRLAKWAIGGKPPGVEVDEVLRDLDKLTTESAKWSDLAANAGHDLAEQLLKLSAHRPTPSGTPNATDERLSRVAIPFDADPATPQEPALANRRLRWRTVLHGLADRAATDHWYDESPIPGPYFERVARAYLADAEKVAEGLPPQSQSAELTAMLAAAPLGFAKPTGVTWTSEQARRFEYLFNPTGKTYPIEGRATGVGRFAAADPIKRAAKTLNPRPSYPVPFEQPLTIPADLLLPSTVTALPLAPTAEVTLYYRGQRPTPKTDIKLNRTPYLILSDPAPRLVSNPDELRASVAIRAASDLEPPTVSILLDYSGSMGQPLDDPNAPVDKTNPNSKFQLAMKELDTALGLLSRDTVLRIRTFSQKEKRDRDWVFGDKDPAKSKVTWRPDFRKPLTDLMEDLKDLTPEGLTPLVKNIETAVEKDFAGATGSKILIVLTDGVEQTGNDRDEGEALDARRRVLTQALKGKDITLYVIAFGLSDKPTIRQNKSMGPSEAELSRQLFEEVPTYDPPGQVIPADNAERLRAALLDALRPRLRFNTRTAAPGEIGVSGWPSRVRGDPSADTRHGLYWSPLVPAHQNGKPTTYTVFPHPSSRATSARLQVDAGDRMILDLVRAPDGAVLVKRGLYGEYFPEKTHRFTGTDGWVATVPGNMIDTNNRDPRYKTLVYLEQASEGASDGSLLRFDRPTLPSGFLWWEVTPVGQKDALGTVQVTKKYGQAAPAWEVMADKWSVNGSHPSAQIRVWVAESVRGATVTVKPTRATELDSLASKVGGDSVNVRVSFEAHTPLVAKSKPDGTTENYVVLRVSHAPDRPVMAKLVPPRSTVEFNTEHRYYKPGEYTALFGPLEPSAFGDGEVTVELYPVAPAKQNPSTVTLTPPQPLAGQPYSEYIPQPSPARNAPPK